MSTRTLATALLLATAATHAAAQPDPMRERFTAHLQATEESDEPRGLGYRKMWNVMDSMALRELNRTGDVDAANRALAMLPGYSGASQGDGVRVGRGVFYGELPRELPGYFLAPVRAGRQPLVLGIFNFGMNSPGRVSVFARREGRWQRTGAVDTQSPVTPYLLPLADSGLALVMLETFTGGDHVDGKTRVWRVRRGALEPLRTLPGEMKEPEARVRDGRVEIAFTRFPQHLSAPILGTRLGYVTTIAPAGTGVSVATAVANPWVEVVDRYYGLVRRSPAGARALLATPSLAARLGTRVPGTSDDGGDLRAGVGWLDIDHDEERFRVTSRRGADGAWRITSVEPAPSPP